VLELVPEDLPDKASAVVHLIQERALRGLVYLGDDVSDVGVFREMARLREEGGLAGLGLAVVDAETPASVRDRADLALEGVDEVEEFLDSLAQALAEAGGRR
jgi:trehalose-phosphatase